MSKKYLSDANDADTNSGTDTGASTGADTGVGNGDSTPTPANPLHSLEITDADYEKAAIKWRTSLLYMPILACKDTLKYMTGIPGVTYAAKVPSAEANAQLAPFKHDRQSAGSTKVEWRELRTYLGNVRIDFVPAQYINTLLGAGSSSLGDGQIKAPTAELVLNAVMRSVGDALNNSLFSASRDASGDTTATLFDGWGTIIDKEITAEKISVAKGNLMELTDEVTSATALEIAKSIERGCDARLRMQEKFLFCPPSFADAYNDDYLTSHNACVYNKQYEQVYLEGSGNKTTIVPLACLDGSDKMILTPKANILYGFDNMSDMSRVEVRRFAPWTITLAAAMFFGCQFHSIDKRLLKVIKFKATAK